MNFHIVNLFYLSQNATDSSLHISELVVMMHVKITIYAASSRFKMKVIITKHHINKHTSRLFTWTFTPTPSSTSLPVNNQVSIQNPKSKIKLGLLPLFFSSLVPWLCWWRIGLCNSVATWLCTVSALNKSMGGYASIFCKCKTCNNGSRHFNT